MVAKTLTRRLFFARVENKNCCDRLALNESHKIDPGLRRMPPPINVHKLEHRNSPSPRLPPPLRLSRGFVVRDQMGLRYDDYDVQYPRRPLIQAARAFGSKSTGPVNLESRILRNSILAKEEPPFELPWLLKHGKVCVCMEVRMFACFSKNRLDLLYVFCFSAQGSQVQETVVSCTIAPETKGTCWTCTRRWRRHQERGPASGVATSVAGRIPLSWHPCTAAPTVSFMFDRIKTLFGGVFTSRLNIDYAQKAQLGR